MQLYSTNNKSNVVDLKQAVLKSLPADKGLYMPIQIPSIEAEWFQNLNQLTITDIAYKIAQTLIGDYIPTPDLERIVSKAINFEAPLHYLSDDIASLELWHGPSLAFKDFGARFMAQLMSYFNKDENKKLTILVATSGDTGGAVAAGFLNTPGIEVIILYPEGKVSHLQEKQLTTLGGNITALEIKGTFDDCQALVKTAFLDADLTKKYNLSSANSINIARLIPQSFYYVDAYRQVRDKDKSVVVAIPSGNFGNLTAGLLAQRMGCPIDHFIAATNMNKVVPDYLDTGSYEPKTSVATISNAMDVGSPSNFTRMQALFDGSHESMSKAISGYSLNDEDTRYMMQEIYTKHDYIADPHGAIGYGAVEEYLAINDNYTGIFLETAHPAKFLDVMETTLENIKTPIPKALANLQDKKKVSTLLDTDFAGFKSWLMGR